MRGHPCPWQVVWAKSFPRGAHVDVEEWLPLWRHLDDSAAVAGRLWDQWLPPNVRALLSKSLPLGEDDARRLLTFLAGVHDIGKATPAFAVQVPSLADSMREVGLSMPREIPPDERRRLPHALAGEVLLERWLVEWHGWSALRAAQLGVVVGGHHGIPPDFRDTEHASLRSELLGTGPWIGVQRDLLERAAHRTGVTERLDDWAAVLLPQPVQVLLSGLVIVADWIASSDLFPLSLPGRQPGAEDQDRLERAWTALRLPGPWCPTLPTGDAPSVIAVRFDLPAGAEIRPVQRLAYDLAHRMDVPGLMVIEAPMGEGKTEAALMAAEVLAARSGAGGCFVALPTQATTDAMFNRVLAWLRRVPDAEVSKDAEHELVNPVNRSVGLAHGKSALNETFRELQFGESVTGVGIDVDVEDDRPRNPWDLPSIEACVHGWTRGRKKGPLADFVVGTIDQLLFTSLRARHLVLRHLGIARKVVIIDEVHSYDVYMGVYLTRALEWLGSYGVPVVMLSATLPPDLKSQLVEAYQRGCRTNEAPEAATSAFGRRTRRQAAQGAAVSSDPVHSDTSGLAYPAVTVLEKGNPRTHVAQASPRTLDVRLEAVSDDLSELERTLAESLSDGGCALVVRNTVKRAQETADALSARFGPDVKLMHARFIGHHRMANDAWLRDRFGSDGRSQRPRRSIVVATQVVEQSLDIDFDLLISDIAPIDLLLQRVGRLHRHPRGIDQSDRPERLRRARFLVTGVRDWCAAPVVLEERAASVYDRHLLLRAAVQVFSATRGGGSIVLPRDIAPLVHQSYSEEPLGPPTWQDEMAEAARQSRAIGEKKQHSAEVFRLGAPRPAGKPILGWLHAGVGEADDGPGGSAQVRDAELAIEVLLLRRDSNGQLRLPEDVPGYSNELVWMHETPQPAMARVIAGCAIRLPATVCAGKTGDQLIDVLEQDWEPTWQRSPLLAGQLVLPIDDEHETVLAGYAFSYDRDRGLDVRRAKED